MRVQYARTYDELRELFEKNNIDIWQTMDEIGQKLDERGIECDTRIRDRGDDAEPVLWQYLVQAMRTEELDAKDRLTSTPFLKTGERAASIISSMTGMGVRPFTPENDVKAAADAETVEAYTLWPDTGLSWSMLPQPTRMTRKDFNTYVANVKEQRGEQ